MAGATPFHIGPTEHPYRPFALLGGVILALAGGIGLANWPTEAQRHASAEIKKDVEIKTATIRDIAENKPDEYGQRFSEDYRTSLVTFAAQDLATLGKENVGKAKLHKAEDQIQTMIDAQSANRDLREELGKAKQMLITAENAPR